MVALNKYVFKGNASSLTIAYGTSVDVLGNFTLHGTHSWSCLMAIPKLEFVKIVLSIDKGHLNDWERLFVIEVQRTAIWRSLYVDMFTVQSAYTIREIPNCIVIVGHGFPHAFRRIWHHFSQQSVTYNLTCIVYNFLYCAMSQTVTEKHCLYLDLVCPLPRCWISKNISKLK